MGEQSTSVLDQTLAVLRLQQSRADMIGVRFVGVVGSVARGEAGPDSDVDIAYDATSEGHLWPLLGIVADIEDALGRRVDIIDREMMPADSWAWMARDLVPV